MLSDGDFQFSEDIAHTISDDLVTHVDDASYRSEEHTSELQSLVKLVCRLLLEKKKIT